MVATYVLLGLLSIYDLMETDGYHNKEVEELRMTNVGFLLLILVAIPTLIVFIGWFRRSYYNIGQME